MEAGKVANCCTKLEDQAEKEWKKEEASRIEVQADDFGANPFHIEHVRALCQSASLGLLQSLRCQIRLDNVVSYKMNILLEVWRINRVGQKRSKEIN